MTKIGYIGLGHMGHPMAENLCKAGYEVHVYDLMPAAMQAMVAAGATASPSLTALAKDADVIITSVQTGQQVMDICLGAEGIFTQGQGDLLYLDCSSIDIATTRSLHAKARLQGITMLDAPVSGGVAAAQAGTLTFMVGGDLAAFERALPLLQCMGKKIVHAGPAGNGQAAKICNNLLLGISMVGVCEAFSLAEKLGLDPKTFFEISSSASGQCWSMTSYCPVPGLVESAPSNRNFQPGFMAAMMLKDLRLAYQAAASVNAAIPLGARTTDLYELFVNQGGGEMDFSGIIQFIAKQDA